MIFNIPAKLTPEKLWQTPLTLQIYDYESLGKFYFIQKLPTPNFNFDLFGIQRVQEGFFFSILTPFD
jgi:hypothetical protein